MEHILFLTATLIAVDAPHPIAMPFAKKICHILKHIAMMFVVIPVLKMVNGKVECTRESIEILRLLRH
jgi:hypothetical protein